MSSQSVSIGCDASCLQCTVLCLAASRTIVCAEYSSAAFDRTVTSLDAEDYAFRAGAGRLVSWPPCAAPSRAAGPAARASSRSSTQAGPLISSSRSKASQCGRSQVSTLASGARARATSVSNVVISSTSSARFGIHRHRQAQLADDRLHGPRFLLRRFAQADRQIGPQDREHDARHAAAGADVEHALALFQQLG